MLAEIAMTITSTPIIIKRRPMTVGTIVISGSVGTVAEGVTMAITDSVSTVTEGVTMAITDSVSTVAEGVTIAITDSVSTVAEGVTSGGKPGTNSTHNKCTGIYIKANRYV